MTELARIETAELARIEQKLARVERMENPISAGIGASCAALYFAWQLANGYIATYTWMIPFFIGSAIPKLFFSFWEARLARDRDALRNPASANPDPIPPARVVTTHAKRALPAPPIEVTRLAPEPAAAPRAGGDDGKAGGPRFLS